MIDLNDPLKIQQIKNCGKTSSGKIIIEYLQFKAKQLDYEKINLDQPCQKIGEEFKAARKARKLIEETINFLTID